MQDPVSGTIKTFDQRNGYGEVVPDIPIGNGGALLVHRKSLRHPALGLSLAPGQRVLFTTEMVPRGLLALDVHLEDDEMDLLRADSEETVEGTVRQTNPERGFGFIELTDGRTVFFHISSIKNSNQLPKIDTSVRCTHVKTQKGYRALEVFCLDQQDADRSSSAHHSTRGDTLLAQAVLARDRKDYDDARQLYRRGMSEIPSVQLVLSYAAFEKNLRRFDAAMDVYKQGINKFPRVAKLREDAGVLAAKLQRTDSAVQHLQSALDLCRNTQQAGEVGVLLALARLYYRIDTMVSLRRALKYYKDAKKVGGIQRIDALSMRVARIRLQHHRGNLVYSFLQSCGFKIDDAELLPHSTTGADLIARIENTEINESYGISGSTLFRCIFKSKVSKFDLDDLDNRLAELAQTELVNDQIAFLILSSVPDELRSSLYRKIDMNAHSQIVIPIAQEAMEKAVSPLSPLRDAMDIWLYRRDLFAHTSPVVGSRFFGREGILATLRHAIAYGKPSGIFGLRKVGKTSLLQECERRAKSKGDIVVYVDLLRLPADISDARWLYWRIGNLLREGAHDRGVSSVKWRLGGRYADYLDLPDEFPVATAFDSDLSALLDNISRSDLNPLPKVVLLLDEIERLLPTGLGKEGGVKGFFEFFSYMRGVAQETTDFVIIITGANPSLVEVAQFDGRDNPVFNFFEEVYLKLLDPEETRSMMRRLGRGMGINFDDGACLRVHQLTGGHPYFARAYCSYVSKQHQTRPVNISRTRVEAGVDYYLESSGKDFEEIAARLKRDYPDELGVCIQLAHSSDPLPLEKGQRGNIWSHGSLKHLIGYQLVDVKDNKVGLTMELFGKWLRTWH